MAKKICISREAHERLKDLRREGETFTEAILRVADDRREG
jgi:predicted CopG family antitoxin